MMWWKNKWLKHYIVSGSVFFVLSLLILDLGQTSFCYTILAFLFLFIFGYLIDKGVRLPLWLARQFPFALFVIVLICMHFFGNEILNIASRL